MRIVRQAEQLGVTKSAYNYEPFQMPTDAVWHYRKFDVEQSFEGEDDRRRQEELTENIARAGIEKPLSIILSDDHRHALIGDGNHRVAAARKLGLSTVPVWIDVWEPEDRAFLSTQGAKDLEPWLQQWIGANL